MIRPIGTDELARALEAGGGDDEIPGGTIRVFDLRPADAYRSAHVHSARHLPPEQALRWVPQWVEPYELVVLVDDDGARGGHAREVAGELAHQWFRRLRYLAGGMEAWLREGRRVEEGGVAGETSASDCGKKLAFHRSGDVPWSTSRRALPPDPDRVKFDLDDSESSRAG